MRRSLAMFACVTDPEAIVIGGGVSKAGQPLIDCIQKYYEKYALQHLRKHRSFLQLSEMMVYLRILRVWLLKKHNILRINLKNI